MTKSEKRKKYCGGCRNNFYNGNNQYGINECWSLESAKVVSKKFVRPDQVPPWNQKSERTLDCHQRDRYVAVNPKATC